MVRLSMLMAEKVENPPQNPEINNTLELSGSVFFCISDIITPAIIQLVILAMNVPHGKLFLSGSNLNI
jgi:hypothetical protein